MQNQILALEQRVVSINGADVVVDASLLVVQRVREVEGWSTGADPILLSGDLDGLAGRGVKLEDLGPARSRGEGEWATGPGVDARDEDRCAAVVIDDSFANCQWGSESCGREGESGE